MEEKSDQLILELAVGWQNILQEFFPKVKLRPKQILVLGCSTSEIIGREIGRGSSLEIAGILLPSLLEWVYKYDIFLAVQGCEHINRALVVEEACAEYYKLEQVTVLPAVNAGGAMAVKAWQSYTQPQMVESVRGHAGIDIGDTFIGMHLGPVVVPVRLKTRILGQAHITFASTRPRLIGGARAVYP
ncbi:MAG TPA: TIGR01440 family protein [Desulfitobacteriaceae bacterium]|nr:TIGR01440 family protein [Desulfitobacteriaceae bacterium]